MYSKESNIPHGVLLIGIGALLMMNPFGLVAFINFIIGALIIGTGLISLVPVIGLPIPLKEKLFMGMGGAGLIFLGLFVSTNPKFLLAILSFSFLLKSINGLMNAFKIYSNNYNKKFMIMNATLNMVFAAIIFFNIGTAISSVVFIIGAFLAISGGVDVLQGIGSRKRVNY